MNRDSDSPRSGSSPTYGDPEVGGSPKRKRNESSVTMGGRKTHSSLLHGTTIRDIQGLDIMVAPIVGTKSNLSTLRNKNNGISTPLIVKGVNDVYKGYVKEELSSVVDKTSTPLDTSGYTDGLSSSGSVHHSSAGFLHSPALLEALHLPAAAAFTALNSGNSASKRASARHRGVKNTSSALTDNRMHVPQWEQIGTKNTHLLSQPTDSVNRACALSESQIVAGVLSYGHSASAVKDGDQAESSPSLHSEGDYQQHDNVFYASFTAETTCDESLGTASTVFRSESVRDRHSRPDEPSLGRLAGSTRVPSGSSFERECTYGSLEAGQPHLAHIRSANSSLHSIDYGMPLLMLDSPLPIENTQPKLHKPTGRRPSRGDDEAKRLDQSGLSSISPVLHSSPASFLQEVDSAVSSSVGGLNDPTACQHDVVAHPKASHYRSRIASPTGSDDLDRLAGHPAASPTLQKHPLSRAASLQPPLSTLGNGSVDFFRRDTSSSACTRASGMSGMDYNDGPAGGAQQVGNALRRTGSYADESDLEDELRGGPWELVEEVDADGAGSGPQLRLQFTPLGLPEGSTPAVSPRPRSSPSPAPTPVIFINAPVSASQPSHLVNDYNLQAPLKDHSGMAEPLASLSVGHPRVRANLARTTDSRSGSDDDGQAVSAAASRKGRLSPVLPRGSRSFLDALSAAMQGPDAPRTPSENSESWIHLPLQSATPGSSALGSPLSSALSPVGLTDLQATSGSFHSEESGTSLHVSSCSDGFAAPVRRMSNPSSTARTADALGDRRIQCTLAIPSSECASPCPLPLSRSLDRSSISAASLGSGYSQTSQTTRPARPLPDQSAFDRSLGSAKFDVSASPVCPATPMRTPTWSHSGELPRLSSSIDEEESGADMAQPTLIRQNSLQQSKLLMPTSTTDPSAALLAVDFRRDFADEGLLGSGTFADVYRVREKATGNLYAVKKSKRQFRSRKDREWLLHEVQCMQRLEASDYLVQLVSAWQESGYFYVQIELAERGTVKDLLTDLCYRGQHMPDSTIWHVLHDVSCGLECIHQAGLVHLDIKPANLLISHDGIVKIGDFGMAAEVGQGEDGREGDTRYLAPELLETSDRQPSADVFSLGLTLYEMCLSPGSAGLPSEGPLWHTLRQGRAVSPAGRPAALQAAIASAMQPNPQLRVTPSALSTLPDAVHTVHHVDGILIAARPHVVSGAINISPRSSCNLAGIVAANVPPLAVSAAAAESVSRDTRSARAPLSIAIPASAGAGDAPRYRVATPTALDLQSSQFWRVPPLVLQQGQSAALLPSPAPTADDKGDVR